MFFIGRYTTFCVNASSIKVFRSFCKREIWKELNISVLILSDRAKEGDTVLDVCCGSGDLAFLLSEKVGIKGKVLRT